MPMAQSAKITSGLVTYICAAAISLAIVAEASGVVGSVNSNTCPDGSVRIVEKSDCMTAASGLGINFARGLRTSSMPAGCAVQQPGESHSLVFFNSHETGGTTSVHAPLCTTDTSGGVTACQQSDTDALGSDCQCDSTALINECSAGEFCWTDGSCMASAKKGQTCTGDLVVSGSSNKNGVYTLVGECNGKGEWVNANGYYITYTDFGQYLNWAVKKKQCDKEAYGWISPSSAGQVASPDLAEGASWANQGGMAVVCVASGSVPTPPPTPVPSPAPTQDLLRDREPKVGTTNSNTCPSGTSRILDENVCMDAAGTLGLKYARALTSTSSPGGCFAQDDLVFYNQDNAGGSNGVHAVVCLTGEAGPSPTPAPPQATPAPTPNPPGVVPDPTPAPTPAPTSPPSPQACPQSDGYNLYKGICRFSYTAYCSAQRLSSYPCLKLQEFVGLGFDFTTTGTSGSELLRASSMGRIAELTLGVPLMPFALGAETWQHSINVDVVKLSGTATSKDKLAQYEDVSSYQKALAAELGVQGSYGIVEAEASVKVETAVQNALEKNSVIGKQETFRPLYLIRLADFTEATDEYLDDVSRVYSREMSMGRFVANYGTHVISEVHVGGRLNVQVRMSSCMSRSARQKALSTAVCASASNGVGSAGACADASVSKDDESKLENSVEDWDVVVEGGDPSKCASKTTCDKEAWTASVNSGADLQILSLKLSELTKFIPNMTHREFMEQGLKYYIGNQSLKVVQPTAPPGVDLCAPPVTPAPTTNTETELSGSKLRAYVGRLTILAVLSTFLSFRG